MTQIEQEIFKSFETLFNVKEVKVLSSCIGGKKYMPYTTFAIGFPKTDSPAKDARLLNILRSTLELTFHSLLDGYNYGTLFIREIALLEQEDFISLTVRACPTHGLRKWRQHCSKAILRQPEGKKMRIVKLKTFPICGVNVDTLDIN